MKNVVVLLSSMLVLITLMSPQCNDESINPDCDGYAEANSSGFIDQDFCFNTLVHYNYEENHSILFTAKEDGNPIYTINVQVISFTGTGVYSCGQDKPGYVELIIHGDDNEFYKSQSGTLSISNYDELHLEANFNVVAVGYNNNESINFSGSVLKAWSK